MALSLPFCTAIAAALTACSALGSPLQLNWEIEEIYTPKAEAEVSSFSGWSVINPLGDILGNGRPTVLIGGEDIENWNTYDLIKFTSGPGTRDIEFRIPQFVTYQALGLWWEPSLTLLRTPTGFQAVINRFPYALEFLDFPNGTSRSVLDPLPPNPGDAPQLGWEGIWNAGDLNQDGFDDLFFQAHSSGLFDGYTGMIDGSSMQVVWRNYTLGDSQVKPITPDPSTGFSDLDGDGVRDFVSGWLYTTPPFTQFSKRMSAFSGMDGSLIWQSQVGDGGTFGVSGKDLNGDGVPDLVTVGLPTEIFAVSGADGLPIWSLDISSVAPLIPATGTNPFFNITVFFEDSTNPIASDTVSVVVSLQTGATPGDEHFVATLRGTDGLPLSVTPFPQSLSPWLPDPIEPNNNQPFLVGDWDRDGLTEIATYFDTPSFDPHGFWPAGSAFTLAVLGKPTIEVPGSHSIGQTNQISFEIPSAGGMIAQLLISSGFDSNGGVMIDHWPTHLSNDALFTWSRSQPLLASLDVDGMGSLDLTIPNNPNFIGTEMFLRGVVWEPGAPFSKVWTMTSLGRSIVTN